MILSSLLGKRSLENPRAPLDPWAATAQGAGEIGEGLASSGVKVNRDRALGVAAFWRGINLITRTVAKLPLGVYRHMEPGRERDFAHAADRLLSVAPNEAMTPFVFKQTITGHVLIEGNGYSYVSRTAGGWPLELLILDPKRTWPVMENRTLWYLHKLKSGEYRKLPGRDVIHVKGYGYDGLEGYPVLHKHRESVGLAAATTSYGSVFFRNSARPNVLLKFPQKLSPEARKNLRESWERMQGGLDNAHRTAILEEGGDAVPVQINARDAQLIESKQFSLIDIANILNLPPSRLGANVATSYGSLEQENQNLLDDAIDPWLVAWEEESGAKLLLDRERKKRTHCIAFDRFPLVRADLAQRGDYYTKALTGGWMQLDEVRAREGMNPMPGGLGRVSFRPLNLQPVGVDADGSGPAEPGKLLDLPDVRQEADWDCGPAAVEAACSFLGVGPKGRAAYVEGLGATPEAGTSPDAVASFLARQGLAVTAASGLEVSDLSRFFAAGQPVLCPCRPDGSAASGHWVAVIGVGLGQVFIHDPAQGRRMMPEDDWLAIWKDADATGQAWERHGVACGLELLPVAEPAEPEPEKPKPEEPDDDDQDDQAGERMRAAVRHAMTDVLVRMVRRVARQAEREAARPGRFLSWLDDSLRQDNVDVMADSFRAVIPAWAAAHRRTEPLPGDVADMLVRDLRERLLAAAGETNAAGLASAVKARMAVIEQSVWSLDVGTYLEGDG